MPAPRNLNPVTDAEKAAAAQRLSDSERYGAPREVWVEDGHVFVESHDGKILSMTPEVAIDLGRKISEAGSDSLINRVMAKQAD